MKHKAGDGRYAAAKTSLCGVLEMWRELGYAGRLHPVGIRARPQLVKWALPGLKMMDPKHAVLEAIDQHLDGGGK